MWEQTLIVSYVEGYQSINQSKHICKAP